MLGLFMHFRSPDAYLRHHAARHSDMGMQTAITGITGRRDVVAELRADRVIQRVDGFQQSITSLFVAHHRDQRECIAGDRLPAVFDFLVVGQQIARLHAQRHQMPRCIFRLEVAADKGDDAFLILACVVAQPLGFLAKVSVQRHDAMFSKDIAHLTHAQMHRQLVVHVDRLLREPFAALRSIE